MAEVERKSAHFNAAAHEESRLDQLEVLTRRSRTRLMLSLNVYDINAIETYLFDVDFLSCFETEEMQSLGKKHEKIDFLDSLLIRHPERCLPFSNAINHFIANAFAESSSACGSVKTCFREQLQKQMKVTGAMDTECKIKEPTDGMETDVDTSSTDSTIMPSSTSVLASQNLERMRPSADGSDKSFSADFLDVSKRIPVGQSQEECGVETALFSTSSLTQENGQQTPPDSDYKTMTSIPGPSSNSRNPMLISNNEYGNDPVRQGILSLDHSKSVRKKRIRHRQQTLFQSSSTHGNPSDQRWIANRDVHIHNTFISLDSKSARTHESRNIDNPFQSFSLTQMGFNTSPTSYDLSARSRSSSEEEQIYQEVKRNQSKLRILQSHTLDLIQYMDIPSLLPHLRGQRLITSSEFERLHNEQDSKKRNRMLITIIPTKGKHALERFLQCLKNENEHSGHVDLAEQLEASLDQLMPSSDV